MKIGRLQVEAKRFPWQGYGWFPHKNGMGHKAILNQSGARFGGGWNYKLGISIGSSSVVLDLVFGIVRISIAEKQNETNQ